MWRRGFVVCAFAALVLLAAAESPKAESKETTAKADKSASGATQATAGPIQVTKKLIDSPLDDIQWADDETVFVLTERGNLYRSPDAGKGWTNQINKLHATAGYGAIRSMHVSKADPRKIFFMGTAGEHYMTDNMGQTYSTSRHPDLHEVRLHPTQSSWILGATMSGGCRKEPKKKCFKVLWLSKDFGKSWTPSTSYVVQFDWAPTSKSVGPAETPSHKEVFSKPPTDPTPTPNDDLVYATVHSIKKGNQKFGMWDKNINFYQTYDYFKTGVELVPHGNRFLFGERDYLFVAAVNPNQETEVSLQVARDAGPNKRFRTALLPVDLTEHSYTILDTSEGAVFLHVNHAPFDTNAPTGHVYISDWSGTRFALSLPYNHRSPDGKCDFEKVEGLEGIYLANFIDEDEPKKGDVANQEESFDAAATTDTRKSKKKGGAARNSRRLKTKTVITFDKGGIWSYLEPPKKDSNGQAITCPKGQECHLHLHGITDLYGPFYSSRTATGLIMSTGTVGKYLGAGDQINTYLSRDAGLTWFEVAKGSHIYEFGDHGGLIVMAYDEGETNALLYSWDQGVTWRSLRISEQPMQVENIIIEPEATSQSFVVYGWQEDSGVLVFVDFGELHERTCQGYDAPDSQASDYETWSPSDGRLGGKCLMGHKVTYTRRKREAQCFNPEEIEHQSFQEHCACVIEDFECDYGYMRKTQNGPCEKDPNAEPEPAGVCVDFYTVTRGYRRVAGDTCVDGAKWDVIQAPCPSWSGSHVGKAIMIILVLVALSLAIATFYNKSEFMESCVERLRGRLSDYDLVGRKLPNSMMDDDTLDDHDIGQAAHLISSYQPSVETGMRPMTERTGPVPTIKPPQ